jgi:hypothetical protein
MKIILTIIILLFSCSSHTSDTLGGQRVKEPIIYFNLDICPSCIEESFNECKKLIEQYAIPVMAITNNRAVYIRFKEFMEQSANDSLMLEKSDLFYRAQHIGAKQIFKTNEL